MTPQLATTPRLVESWNADPPRHCGETIVEALTMQRRPRTGLERYPAFAATVLLRRYTWYSAVMSQIESLLSLEPDWNGYGERPVHRSAIDRAINILGIIGGPCPDLAPTWDGGVHIEWYDSGIGVELIVPPVGAVAVALESGNEILASSQSWVWSYLKRRLAEDSSG